MDELRAVLIEHLKTRSGDHDAPFMASSKGSYSINKLITEIENKTEVGNDMCRKILALTIDLLSRGKEKLS